MELNQTLTKFSSKAIEEVDAVIKKVNPNIVVVQGDTTTAFIGGLVAFYNKIKVCHIEAGLRTFDKSAPFPEEINRTFLTYLADYHFCPTESSYNNVIRCIENKESACVKIVGNTGIDALLMADKIIKENRIEYESLKFQNKIILLTCHRRENFGDPFKNIMYAVVELSKENVDIVFPVHPNPHIKNNVSMLNGIKNIHLVEPLDYPEMVYLMKRSYLIMTDSGGVQEEAPIFGTPVLVLREKTERQEVVFSNNTKLVGSDKEKIIKETLTLLNYPAEYEKMNVASNVYGDGKASERIINILVNHENI